MTVAPHICIKHPRETSTGGCGNHCVDTTDSTAINAAIDVFDLETHKTARLSRRTARALRGAMEASYAALDAHALSLVLLYYTETNKPSTAIRDGQTRDYVDAFRALATAIFRPDCPGSPGRHQPPQVQGAQSY